MFQSQQQRQLEWSVSVSVPLSVSLCISHTLPEFIMKKENIYVRKFENIFWGVEVGGQYIVVG